MCYNKKKITNFIIANITYTLYGNYYIYIDSPYSRSSSNILTHAPTAYKTQ